MKEIIKNIFNKIKDSGNVKIDTSYLKDNSWFYITDEVFLKKVVYIFRSGGELLISEDGDITKAKWENLIHSTDSMLLEIDSKTSLYNIIYLTSEYLVLQKDGTEQVKVFIKQQHYTSKLPKGLNENPIEMVFNDLNASLNSNNTSRAYHNELNSSVNNEISTKIELTNKKKYNYEVVSNSSQNNIHKSKKVEESIVKPVKFEKQEEFKY